MYFYFKHVYKHLPKHATIIRVKYCTFQKVSALVMSNSEQNILTRIHKYGSQYQKLVLFEDQFTSVLIPHMS